MTPRRLAAALVVLLVTPLAAGCHDEPARSSSPATIPSGPPGVVRIALAHLDWPLDPALVADRDSSTVARALFATPLRTDRQSGGIRPGLCRSWRGSADGRTWTFRCRRADAVAAALRRVAGLRDSPSQWLFAAAERVERLGPDTVRVRLRFPWRRFPYALTLPAAAPPDVPGAFRVVAASGSRIVAERPGLRLVFVELEPHLAAAAFRRGLVDEAPVPLGDLRAVRADPSLLGELRVRPLRGVDLVDLGSMARRDVRLAYWRTAARADYSALVPEFSAPPAVGLLRIEGAEERASPGRFRDARRAIRALAAPPKRIGVPDDPELASAAALLAASWRDVGLRVAVARGASLPERPGAARFRRLIAPYPRPEALLASLLMARGGPAGPRALVARALGARDPLPLLARADDELQAEAAVVPVAWVSDARLVSRRLRGWRHDTLGDVDYRRVRTR